MRIEDFINTYDDKNDNTNNVVILQINSIQPTSTSSNTENPHLNSYKKVETTPGAMEADSLKQSTRFLKKHFGSAKKTVGYWWKKQQSNYNL